MGQNNTWSEWMKECWSQSNSDNLHSLWEYDLQHQSCVYHMWCSLVLPISVTLLRDSSHRLLNPVSSRVLEAVADKTVRVLQAPWDERSTRRPLGLCTLSWLLRHGLRDLQSQGNWPCSAQWGQRLASSQETQNFQPHLLHFLGPPESRGISSGHHCISNALKSYLQLLPDHAGCWSRTGTGRLCSNQAALKDIIILSNSLIASTTPSSQSLEDIITQICPCMPACITHQHHTASCIWFPGLERSA